MHHPQDGVVNPGMAALALATGAHARGVVVREGVRVSGIRRAQGRVSAVETDRGVVQCERVVLACGQWTRDLAAKRDAKRADLDALVEEWAALSEEETSASVLPKP